MSISDLLAKLKSLSPEQRQVVESLIERLAKRPTHRKQTDLKGHPSFGAWAGRMDLLLDSDKAARGLRERTATREL